MGSQNLTGDLLRWRRRGQPPRRPPGEAESHPGQVRRRAFDPVDAVMLVLGLAAVLAQAVLAVYFA